MRHSHRAVAQIVGSRSVIVRREHSELSGTIDHLVATGHLIAVLPGIYGKPPGTDLRVRIAAVAAWNPDAVLIGAAAARTWFWPSLSCPTVEVAVRHAVELRRAGFVFVKRQIPSDLVEEWSGTRMTVPALTALDLCESLGGEGIDVALRTRATTLAQLHRALELTPRRRGNRLRSELLHESRSEPWSPPERKLHGLLRAAEITGWRGNVEGHGSGWKAYPDVAFEDVLLDIEVDGREHHDTRAAFENDRLRQNRLVRAGWTVLRFTPTMIDADPDGVVATIRDTLDGLRARRDWPRATSTTTRTRPSIVSRGAA